MDARIKHAIKTHLQLIIPAHIRYSKEEVGRSVIFLSASLPPHLIRK